MKRFTGILAAAAIAIAPMSASALEALTDNAMNDVTAQAGVSIAIDDVVIYQTSIADTTYTDTDSGLGIKIDYADTSNKLSVFNAIEGQDGATVGEALYGVEYFNGLGLTGYDADTVGIVGGGAETGYQTKAAALSIDVGTCETMTAGKFFNGDLPAGATVGGVVIGLPTLEITTYRSNDSKTISMVFDADSQVTNTAANTGLNFVKITKDGYSKMAILGGTIEIAPHP